jgi:hypothetical protein
MRVCIEASFERNGFDSPPGRTPFGALLSWLISMIYRGVWVLFALCECYKQSDETRFVRNEEQNNDTH